MSPKIRNLPPFGALNTAISQRDSTALADLLNSQTPASSELLILLRAAAQSTIQVASQHPSSIDALLQFYADAALKLRQDLFHPGNQEEVELAARAGYWRKIGIRPSTGSDLLSEVLAVELFDELRELTSRTVTPSPRLDEQMDKDYYLSACTNAMILARAFCKPLFQEFMWRTMENIFIKALFSGTQQEPGNFIVVPVLIYAAGNAIKGYLAHHLGRGKDWYIWQDMIQQPDATWDWSDLTAIFQDPASLVEEGFDKALPPLVYEAFKSLATYVGDGKLVMRDLSSSELWEKFKWVEDIPDPPTIDGIELEEVSVVMGWQDDEI